MKKTIVILGGYGNFGKRIAQYFISDLATASNQTDNQLTIYIAGRRLEKATQFCDENNNQTNVEYKPLKIDIYSPSFKATLETINPNIVVHTSGPFQGQSHFVAKT